MLNPAVDSSELEVNIITDEAVGSLEPKNTEFKYQNHEQLYLMLTEAYNQTKNLVVRTKVKLVHYLKLLSSSVLRHLSTPRLQIKNRSSRARRSRTACTASGRSSKSNDGDSIPSDPYYSLNPFLPFVFISFLFLLKPLFVTVASISINEVAK
ncbi:hypothetical protein ACMGGJ_05090 [Enterobacter sp. BNK-32]|uniref:hypothetical protein n=1 Tax=Enterobacter sp. BNK-32 TaxID=3376168 RepID=UPI003B42A6A4